jgi:hypothetical protein
MTQDEVLATLHRVVQENKHYTTWTVSTPHLVALVREVIEQEREACAKMCDALAVHPEYASEVTKLAALAIRARGQA